jgi:hypothetical protein
MDSLECLFIAELALGGSLSSVDFKNGNAKRLFVVLIADSSKHVFLRARTVSSSSLKEPPPCLFLDVESV